MKKISLFIFIGIVIFSCNSKRNYISRIEFDHESKDELLCDLIFSNPETDIELLTLRKEYKLDSLIKTANTDIEKSLILLNWTNTRWKHNGDNEPEKHNALNILKEAEEGKRFRCVEYGIVLSASMNSIGIPTRTLGLKTKDVETTQYGAGHVVSEAYISEYKKWVFMDGQMNYIPFLNGIPLNAVEYQNAVVHNKNKIELRSLKGAFDKDVAIKKINWIAKYLFYFDVFFDSSGNKATCNEKSRLMLVPLKEKNPTVFQITSKIDNCYYTNNLQDFYKAPKVL